MIDIELWKNALLAPAKTFKPLVKKASLGQGLKVLAVGLVIAGIIAGVIQTIFNGFLGAFSVITSPIVMLIAGLVGAFIGVGIVWIIAKLLGGKGSYGAQFHLAALVMAPVFIINAILNIIPIVGGLIGSLLSLYSLWPHIVAVREVHGFSTGRAAVAVLVPLIIAMIIAFVLAVILAAAIAGLGLAGLAAFGGIHG